MEFGGCAYDSAGSLGSPGSNPLGLELERFDEVEDGDEVEHLCQTGYFPSLEVPHTVEAALLAHFEQDPAFCCYFGQFHVGATIIEQLISRQNFLAFAALCSAGRVRRPGRSRGKRPATIS